jgi:hypothetical protein
MFDPAPIDRGAVPVPPDRPFTLGASQQTSVPEGDRQASRRPPSPVVNVARAPAPPPRIRRVAEALPPAVETAAAPQAPVAAGFAPTPQYAPAGFISGRGLY